MRAAGASFNWQSSISFLSLMELRRIAKNTISCNTVMNACSSAVKWEHSLLLAAAVPHSRLHADVVTPSLAISAHAVFGRWQDVLVVIEESFPNFARCGWPSTGRGCRGVQCSPHGMWREEIVGRVAERAEWAERAELADGLGVASWPSRPPGAEDCEIHTLLGVKFLQSNSN